MRKPFFYFFGGVDDEIYRKQAQAKRQSHAQIAFPARLPLLCAHDDQQIHVAIRRWMAVSLRAEENNLLRLHLFNEFLERSRERFRQGRQSAWGERCNRIEEGSESGVHWRSLRQAPLCYRTIQLTPVD
jgi:hypothetical protein